MRKSTFLIDGGLGRVVCSIPALEQYYHNMDPDEDFNVIVRGWDQLFWNHPILQDRTYGIHTKGLFENIVKDSTFIYPEPYHLYGYYNQHSNLVEAFDIIINKKNNYASLDGCLHISSIENMRAKSIIEGFKKKHGKDKFIIFQPYGSNMQFVDGEPIDPSNRSLSVYSAMELATLLAKDNIIMYFGDHNFIHPKDNVMLNTKELKNSDDNIRFWMAMIANCDYFIGCDSSGQHIARAFNKKGFVIMGASHEVNVTYLNHFKTYRKKDRTPSFAPLRISDVDIEFANRLNDGIMNFDKDEIVEMYNIITKEINYE